MSIPTYSNSGTMYAVVGGYCYLDLPCGPFYADLSFTASASYSYLGAALSCKPLADDIAEGKIYD